MARQHLHSITYCNDELGPATLENINLLMPQLIELRLIRLRTLNNKIVEQLFETMFERSSALMKLRLSDIPGLTEPKIFEALIQMIKTRTYLQELDVSECNFRPTHLISIIDATHTSSVNHLKSFNISYNDMTFDRIEELLPMG